MNIFDHSLFIHLTDIFEHPYKVSLFSGAVKTSDQTDIVSAFVELLPNGEKDKQNHKIRLLQIVMNAVKERFRLL